MKIKHHNKTFLLFFSLPFNPGPINYHSYDTQDSTAPTLATPSISCSPLSHEPIRQASKRNGQRGGRRGRRRPGLRGPAAGATRGHRRARQVVAVPRRHRRVRRHTALPLHHGGHGDRVQAPDRRVGLRRGRGVRRRGHPRHRVGVRRHDLHPRLLHSRHLRRPHQPGGNIRPLPGAQGVPGPRGALHRRAVPRCRLRRRARQGVPELVLRQVWRRRQRARHRVLHGHRPRRGDNRYLRARVHRVLRHRPQAQRPRLPCPGVGAAAYRVRRVHGAPGNNPRHGHRHQPGEEPRRRRRLQQQQGMERSVDLLGRAVHRSGDRGAVPPDRPPCQR